MFEYKLCPIYYFLLLTKFIHINSFNITISLYNASADIVDNEDSFEVSPKAKFTSPLYIYIILATDNEAKSPHFSQLQCC